MSVADRAVELGGVRQVVDIGNSSVGGFINPYGVLERLRAGDVFPKAQSSVDMQALLGEATGFQLRRQLMDQIGIGPQSRLFLVDDPRSVTSVWLAHTQESMEAWGDLIDTAAATVVLDRNGPGYKPAVVRVSGKDISTGRPFAVTYDFATYPDPESGGLVNQVTGFDVGLATPEAPKANPDEYHFTVPVPTPIELGWHNMYSAGLFTRGMIPTDGEKPLYEVAITGRLDGGLTKGTKAGSFSLVYRQPFATNYLPLGDYAIVEARFEPNKRENSYLRPWQLEIPSTLAKYPSR